MVEARLKSGIKVQTGKLGMEGSPFHLVSGARIKFPSEDSYRRAVELYGDGTFELVERPKAGVKKGGDK